MWDLSITVSSQFSLNTNICRCRRYIIRPSGGGSRCFKRVRGNLPLSLSWWTPTQHRPSHYHLLIYRSRVLQISPSHRRTKMTIPSSSSCNQPQKSQSESRMWISFAIYEPQDGCDIHDAVAHMARVAALLEKRSNIDVAILKSLQQSWAAVFAVWKGGSSSDGLAPDLPEAAAFTKGMTSAVKIVDSGWFRLTSREISRGVPSAQLSLGDFVGLRRIYTSSWKIQDMLSYCCLAILKSYFTRLKGILSSSFYESLDGKQIIGLGVWDSIESASVLVNKDDDPSVNPWVSFWRSLGAKKLKYHVCQVVYVTFPDPSSLQNSRPGFQI